MPHAPRKPTPDLVAAVAAVVLAVLSVLYAVVSTYACLALMNNDWPLAVGLYAVLAGLPLGVAEYVRRHR